MRTSHSFLLVIAMVALTFSLSGCLPDQLTDTQIDEKICQAAPDKCLVQDTGSGDVADHVDTLGVDTGSADVVSFDTIDTKGSDAQGDVGVDVGDDTSKEDVPDSSGDAFDGGDSGDSGDSADDVDDGADAPDSVSSTDTTVFDDTPDSSDDVGQDGGDVEGDAKDDTVSDDSDSGALDSVDGVNTPDAASETDAGQDDTTGDTQVTPDSSDAGSQDTDASSDSSSDTTSPDTSDPDTSKPDANVPKCTTAGCDDNNPCTDNACNMATGCTVTNNTKTCDDGDACTQKDTCSAGKCVGKTNTCNDGDICTTDSCDSKKGCLYILKSGCKKCSPVTVDKDCNDGNNCTGQACSSGQCQFWALNGASCSDADACTVGDVCKGDTCTAKLKTCNDGNDCTTDSCDKLKGCVFDFNANSCDDGKVCTVDDACSSGACKGKAKVCNDGNVCTDDSCDPKLGCVKSSNSASCDNGDACTSLDKCNAGTCKAGTSKICDDQDACTLDTCDSKTGKCVFVQKNGCWVSIWNPVVKPGFSMGKSESYGIYTNLYPLGGQPRWGMSKIPGSNSKVSSNTFNFISKFYNYCGHPDCKDTSNPKNVVGGTAEFPVSYDLTEYKNGSVRIAIRLLNKMNDVPDTLSVQVSTDDFAGVKVDGTCASATAKTSGTVSYIVKKTDPKKWVAVVVDLPFAAGKKVKLRMYFASCDAYANANNMLLIDFFHIEATKLK